MNQLPIWQRYDFWDTYCDFSMVVFVCSKQHMSLQGFQGSNMLHSASGIPSNASMVGHHHTAQDILVQLYIPTASVSCIHAPKSTRFANNLCQTQPNDPFAANMKMERLLISVIKSCQVRCIVQATSVAAGIGKSICKDPCSCNVHLIDSQHPTVAKNLEVACMSESDQASLGTILRHWYNACQVLVLLWVVQVHQLALSCFKRSLYRTVYAAEQAFCICGP